MDYITASCTDVGIRKETNQDSFCIKIAATPIGKIAMAVVCDGMGGLSKGELASATVVRAFSDWFEQELPQSIPTFSIDNIKNRWGSIIQEQNNKIADYGSRSHIDLGTTLTALLVVDKQCLLIAHVGDSRVYKIGEQLEILTQDQTVVAQEVRRGTLTKEEAENDPRRNVLLQCIGASKTVIPEFIVDSVESGCVYMLCTDGFRHVITEEEIQESFQPQTLINEETMKKNAFRLVEENKRRMEKDNITVLLLKTIG